MKKIKLWHFPLIMILFVSALFFVPMEDVQAGNGRTYTLPYNEPMADENNGYVVVEYYNASVGYFTNTWMWSVHIDTYGEGAQYQHEDVYAGIDINPDSFFLDLYGPVFSDISGFVSFYDASGNYVLFETYGTGSSSVHTSQLHPSAGNTITGFYYKGNVNWVATIIDAPQITVSFADNGATQLNINEIIYQLTRLNEDTDELIQQIVNIYNNTTSMKNALNNINSQIIVYLPRLYNQNADIIALLEKIEAYLAYPDNGSGEKVEDFGSIIIDKNNNKQESDSKVEDSITTDKNGVASDDFGQHGSNMLDVIDSITGKSMEIYYEILNMVTDYPIVTNMILIVFVFAFCGFIFFGRR